MAAGSRAWATAASSWSVDRKSTRLNSCHVEISYAVFCLKKKKDTDLGGGVSDRQLGDCLAGAARLGTPVGDDHGRAGVLGPLHRKVRALQHLFFFKGYADHRDLHSFPTRRSSDLRPAFGSWERPPCPRSGSAPPCTPRWGPGDRKSTRLNSSHVEISYAVFCL